MQLNWKTIIKNIGQNIGLALLFFMATAQADTANLPQDQRTGAQPQSMESRTVETASGNCRANRSCHSHWVLMIA